MAVVQVKDGNGKIQVLKINKTIQYGLVQVVIIQNELSASASEILAGAIQDYGEQ